MANTYTLTTTKVLLTAVSIVVGSRTGDALTVSQIKMQKFNGTIFEDFSAFTLASAPAATETTAKIIPTAAFLDTDLVTIQINDSDTSYSDKLLLDFAEDYDDTDYDADYKYELPTQLGTYTMKLNKVNGDDFSSVSSPPFNVGNKPLPANCSITIAKDYLVKYTEEILDLTVVLNNADDSVPTGNYEVSIGAILS
ncbi:MAG: hypothetical protein ACERKV_03655 [Clostridiaceae bacterium]